MKIGIIQGRLSEPKEGFQDTPTDWKREFEDLKKNNLNHIEWIITKDSFNNNPFFKENLKNFPIHAVCADNLVDTSIDSFLFVSNNLDPICVSALNNDIKYITVPLLEDSNLLDNKKRERFKDILMYFAKKYPDINFSLEAELPVTMLKELLVTKNVSVTYDTGNITSCGYNHIEYIEEVFDKISNVHLKDRTFDGNTVVPTTGNTDFETIFKTLIKNNYQKIFTLQTAREEEGKELETIKKHTDLLRGVYEKCI